jgi:hypothetical protein
MVTRSTAKQRAMGHVEPSAGAVFLGDVGYDSDEHVCCTMRQNIMFAQLFWQQDSPNICGSKAARLQDKGKGKLAMKIESDWTRKRNMQSVTAKVTAQKQRKTGSWGKSPPLGEDPDETWQDEPVSEEEDTNKNKKRRSEASLCAFVVIYVCVMLNVLKVTMVKSPKKDQNSKWMFGSSKRDAICTRG